MNDSVRHLRDGFDPWHEMDDGTKPFCEADPVLLDEITGIVQQEIARAALQGEPGGRSEPT